MYKAVNLSDSLFSFPAQLFYPSFAFRARIFSTVEHMTATFEYLDLTKATLGLFLTVRPFYTENLVAGSYNDCTIYAFKLYPIQITLDYSMYDM